MAIYSYCRQLNESVRKPFYFYHMVDKGSDLSNGILSLEYMYRNNMLDMFDRYTMKYRNRLCEGWGIYPGRDPKNLTSKEVHDGLVKFRNTRYACYYIWFFRYPPYEILDPRFKALYTKKDLYRINLDELSSQILDIDWGYVDSYTGGKPLNRRYYETVTPREYFKNFNPNNELLFSSLYHIAIATSSMTIPADYITQIETPRTLQDVIREV